MVELRFIGVKIRQSAEKKKGTGPIPIALFHNLKCIDTGYKCKSGFFEMNLSGTVYKAMYKQDLYIEMRFPPRFSDQVYRNLVDSWLIPRDLYMEMSFC